MDILTADCHTCDTEVEVFVYWTGHDYDGRDQWDLVEVAHYDDHHDHDVSITGRA